MGGAGRRGPPIHQFCSPTKMPTNCLDVELSFKAFRVLDLGDDDSLNVEPRLFTLAHQFAQVVRDLA